MTAVATYHLPVMVEEAVASLVTDPDGIYLDATVGGGGHSQGIIEALGVDGRLLAADCDAEALAAATLCLEKSANRVKFLRGSFAELDRLLDQAAAPDLAGGLFDLGVSSAQIDEPVRGFSYRVAGPLDMRMDQRRHLTASGLIANSSEDELARIIWKFGEERRAREIARSVCRWRKTGDMVTTMHLRAAVEATGPKHLSKTLARVFQALRIAVNDELGELERGLETVCQRLTSGGRLAVIAYHSLEDRLVKTRFAQLLRGCICPPRIAVCVCEHQATFAQVGSGFQRAGSVEVSHNSRARSAVLRVYEKL